MSIIYIKYYYLSTGRCWHEYSFLCGNLPKLPGNMLQLRKELLAVEEDRLHGSKGYSVDEVAARMRHAIWEAVTHETAVKTTAF